MTSPWKRAWWLAALVLTLATPPLFSIATDSEDELKSAAVWLFVQYSQLPPAADGAIEVAIVGRPSFAAALRRTLQGKTAGGRPVRVVESGPDFASCQILYLATDKTEEVRRALQNAQSQKVLTIGESDRFLVQGGAVNLFFVDGHIGFEASLEALERAGVTISSNLLKFGQIHNRPKGAAGK